MKVTETLDSSWLVDILADARLRETLLKRAEAAEAKLAKIQAKADVYSIPWLEEILEGEK